MQNNLMKGIFILAILVTIPTVVIFYDVKNDIANTFPTYEDTAIISSSVVHEKFIHELPPFTGILLNVEKSDTTDTSLLQIFLMSKTTYDLYKEGKKLFGLYTDAYLVPEKGNTWLNASFESGVELYLVIRVVKTEIDQSPVDIQIEFVYEPYIIRKGISLFFYLSLYIIGSMLIRNKVGEYKVYRSIKKYEDKIEREEDTFLDRVFGPLD